MQRNILLTIFTPTYNRCGHLKMLYEDLKAQTCKNFEWLVIDDGSTDDTKSYFDKISEEHLINIKYVRKENGGKHTAYNLACSITDTELIFITMDSDDRLKRNAVKQIEDAWNRYESKGICGLVFLCEDVVGRKLYTTYDRKRLDENPSWVDAYREKMFWGEAEYILKTDYARNYLYPQYSGEKFFNEAYTYMQMKEPLYWSDLSIYVRDYQEDGLTNHFLKNVYKSPQGYADYNNIKSIVSKNFATITRAVLFYDVFSMTGRRKCVIKGANRKLLAAVLMPMAFVLFIGLKLKLGRSQG